MAERVVGAGALGRTQGHRGRRRRGWRRGVLGRAGRGGGGLVVVDGLLTALDPGQALLQRLDLRAGVRRIALGDIEVVGEAIDLVVAGAGGLFEVVDPRLQGGELGIRLGGDADLHGLAGVLGLEHDLAQLPQLLLDALDPFFGGIGRLGRHAGAGDAEQDDGRGRRGPKGSGSHVRVILCPHVENAAKLDAGKGRTAQRPLALASVCPAYRAPEVMAVWALRSWAQASSPAPGSIGRSLP